MAKTASKYRHVSDRGNEDIGDMFLDEVIAPKKAGLTKVSAKVQELRMAECKPLKRTDVRLEPSNLKFEVEELCTGGIFESQIVKRQNDDVTYNDAHVPTAREKDRESANSFFNHRHTTWTYYERLECGSALEVLTCLFLFGTSLNREDVSSAIGEITLDCHSRQECYGQTQ